MYWTTDFRFLPEDLQDMVDDIVYSNIEPTPDEEKVIQKYTKFAEMKKPQVILIIIDVFKLMKTTLSPYDNANYFPPWNGH